MILGLLHWINQRSRNSGFVAGIVFSLILTLLLPIQDVEHPAPDLSDQVDRPVALFLADGAYDGEPTSDFIAARFGPTSEVTIPPPKNVIPSPNAAKDPTARDWHIAEIAACGRMAWQEATGYNQRSRGETPPLMHAPHTLPGSAWAAGKQLLGPSKRRALSNIRKQKPRLASAF